MNSFVKNALTHAGVLFVFLLLTAIYFLPQLNGKVARQNDIVQYLGMSQEVREFKEKTGETSLWTNAMFGGMPTYQINTIRAGNNLRWVDRAGRLGLEDPIGRFFAAMAGFYLLMLCLGAGPLVGAIGAIAFGFTTNNLILFEAGHMTKLATISYLPIVAAGVLLAFRERYLIGGLLFALGMGLNVSANHPQMTYYFGLTLLIYGVAQLIYNIRNNKLMPFAKATGVLVLAGLLGAASAASNLLVTYEYSRDTMRGEPILQSDAAASAQQSSSQVEGLAWDYAMQWSNGTLDLFASFIPGVVGGGSQELLGKNSAIRTDLNRRGANLPADFAAPLYWGELPFTSGPAYFGAVVFFFFLMGLMLVKGPAKWWLAIGTLFTLLLSLGKNLPGFNQFVFDYLPLYNKFRTPNSILSVTAFLVPMLGLLALHEVFKKETDARAVRRAVFVAGGIAGGIALFFWLIGPAMFDFRSPGDDRMAQAGYNLDAVIADRKSLMRSDALRTLILVLLSGGLIWGYLQKWAQRNIILLGIGVLVLFDVRTVGKRYLNDSSFVNKSAMESTFRPRQVDDLIRKDNDPNFRVLDFSENTFNSSFTSYFHKSIGGYHAAKLQRYQDLIDRHLSKNNEQVFNMLNTKYFILPGQNNQQPEVQINMAAMGNAWFVSNVRMVDTPNQEIDALSDFDPAYEAIIHKEFSDYLNGFQVQLDSGAIIRLTDYKPNHLTYESDAGREQLVVFSEIWYGPNKGWQAYIDGQPVEHIRANYVLRAMRVPAGAHKIEFVFAPKTYERGKLISMVTTSVIVLGLLGMTGFYGYEAYQKAANEPRPTPPSDKPTAPTPKKATPAPRRPIAKGKKKRK